jgi:hypothetical protein
MKFTDAQKNAIGWPPGNLQFIACAGSGKTEVVAQRAAALLKAGATLLGMPVDKQNLLNIAEHIKLEELCNLEHFRVRCIVIAGETLRQTDDGEIVWRRSASQVAGGP